MIPVVSLLQLMSIAISIMYGCGPSSEILCQLLLKKTMQGNTELVVNIATNNNMEHFSFKSECAVWAAKH